MSDTFDNRPFGYRATRSGQVRITHEGRTVTVLAGAEAKKFLAKVAGADGLEQQQVMARVTGNFKRGNERQGKT